MASKKVTLKGGQLVDTDTDIVGFVADDESGLHFVPDEDTGEAQQAYSTVTHMVNETDNPLWNQVTYKISDIDTTTSTLYDGHVTLQGIKPDGTMNNIMDFIHNTTSTTTEIKTFDMLTSSCTNDIIKNIPNGASGGGGTIDVELPLRFENYEDVDIMPNWYDTNWAYRIALQIEKSGGFLHGYYGHNSDNYGIVVRVPYMANMSNVDFREIRFTARDGITELPYYILEKTDSTQAICIVMIPSYFMDLNNEATRNQNGSYASPDPQYIHCYYGNANATDASDVTLGGYGFFGDDFTDNDITDWTLVTPANTSIAVASGIVTLNVTANNNGTCSMTKALTGITSTTDAWEIIFKTTAIYPSGGTVVDNGCTFRIKGVGAEDTSWWDAKAFYKAAGASVTTASAAGYLLGWGYSDSGVAGTDQWAWEVGGTSTETRYIKMRRQNSNSGYGSAHVTWYASKNGHQWDFIGHTLYTSTVFDTSTNLEVQIIQTGTAALAIAKYVRVDSIIAYPIMANEYELPMVANFTNSNFYGRHVRINAAAGRVFSSPAANTLSMAGTTTDCQWTTATKNPMILYTSGVSSGTPVGVETKIYEATITSLVENAAAGNFQEAGICLIKNATLATADAQLFGIRWTTTGAARGFYMQGFTAGTAGTLYGPYGSWTQADLPITLRIRLDHRHKSAFFDAKKKDGEWLNIISSYIIYNDFKAKTLSSPAIYMRNNGAQNSTVTFSQFKASTLGALPTTSGYTGNATANDITWLDEEAYADYPLAYSVTPTDLDKRISFTSPTPMKRNNPTRLRLKDYGGDYNYSKILYLTDDDYISIGPSGTDQYIGMRLEFDFNMAATDEFNVDEINFIYEVI